MTKDPDLFLATLSKKALRKVGYKVIADRVRYRSDIVAFAEEVLHLSLASYQKEILQTFLAVRKLAVRGPHGIGKTTLSAIIILWAVTCFDVDVKVLTTASAWRQLIHYTWPEVHKWARAGDWSKVGVQVREGAELSALTLSIGDRRAFAAASDNAASIEGAHATIVIVVFDEAKEIPAPTWDALEGAFSTGLAYAFAISTPGAPEGRFYDIHKRKRGYEDWTVRHVTLAEAIANGRILQQWADERLAQWGAESSVYQNRVLGNFAENDESSVVPLAWIEASNERWHELHGIGSGKEVWGCDPGYTGTDPTALAKIVGTLVESIKIYPRQDLMVTAGRIAGLVQKATPVGVDTIGVGAGVYSRLAELGYNAMAINVSESTELTDHSGQVKFKNLRSYIWWSLREALDPSLDINLALPPDDELTGELTSPTWMYMSNGKIQVEGKPEIRARLGRSTNKADAVGLGYYAGAHRGPTMEEIEAWGSNKIRADALSDGILKLLKESGVDVEKELEI